MEYVVHGILQARILEWVFLTTVVGTYRQTKGEGYNTCVIRDQVGDIIINYL